MWVPQAAMTTSVAQTVSGGAALEKAQTLVLRDAKDIV